MTYFSPINAKEIKPANKKVKAKWEYKLFSEGMTSEEISIDDNLVAIKQSKGTDWLCFIKKTETFKDTFVRSIACGNLKTEEVIDTEVQCAASERRIGNLTLTTKAKSLTIALTCNYQL